MGAYSYVDRGGELSWLPPYSAQGVNFFGFVVCGQQPALQGICDRYLNQPLGQPGRFTSLTSHALIVFNSIERLQSQTKPEWGWTTEQEMAVWLLVFDTKTFRLSWFHPYMFVDSDAALVSGREVYGFPKALGWFDISQGPVAPSSLSIDTMVVRQFGINSQRQRETLVRADLQKPSDIIEVFTDVGALVSAVARGVSLDFSQVLEPGLANEVMDSLVRLDVPMVFLKEFRSGEQPEQACFRVNQSVDAKLVKLHDARIYLRHEYELGILDADSHPIRRDLGLPAGPVRVDLSFWVSFDLAIGNTKLITQP